MAAALPQGYRRRAFDNVPSTNAEALIIARRGAPGGLWITAAEQSAGRGRRGRTWSTARGNLAASLMLIDPGPAAIAPTLSFVAGVALHRAVVDVTGAGFAERIRLKWPNDLLLDGYKLGGILVEGENLPGGPLAVVVGIGVNCVSHPEATDSIPATDLASVGAAVTAGALFDALALRMAEEIATWNRGAGFATTREAWLQRAAGLGQTIRVNLADRQMDGRFEALDETGRLILLHADGRREAVSAGDVFFAPTG
jgi:BirA family biotin operon repressor/biotin-[acetyl-CoA-carboxylase] ligase